MVDTDDIRRKTDDGQCHGYGISSSQVSQKFWKSDGQFILKDQGQVHQFSKSYETFR